ncbi:hypothetical protein V7793_32680 [Streptomyces sp. KLMMK]|uniref:hypothetical protein n=1 Tax=Streptomyces sp. KLMMK TaxID=3109353 RepID=UPI0030084329
MTSVNFPPQPDFVSKITIDELIVKKSFPEALKPVRVQDVLPHFTPSAAAAACIEKLANKWKWQPYHGAHFFDVDVDGSIMDGDNWPHEGWNSNTVHSDRHFDMFAVKLIEREPVIKSYSRIENEGYPLGMSGSYSHTTTFSHTKSYAKTWGWSANISLSLMSKFGSKGGMFNGSFSYTSTEDESWTDGEDFTDTISYTIDKGYAGSCDLRFQGGVYVGWLACCNILYLDHDWVHVTIEPIFRACKANIKSSHINNPVAICGYQYKTI